MKKKVFSFLFPLIISILVGYVCGKIVYSTYSDGISNELKSSKIYLIENGNYDTYEEMREANNKNNYLYYIDEDKYRTVVGITQRSDNIEKIKKIYNDNLLVDECYISNENINSEQVKYDKELNEISTNDEIRSIVDDILGLYKKDESVRLVSIK